MAALVLLAAALAGGTLFTLLFDDEAPLGERLAAGIPLGLASLGLIGFVAASVLGMGTAALALAGLGVLWPLPVLLAGGPPVRGRLRTLLRPGPVSWPLAAGFTALVALLWRVYDRAMFVTAAGAIATGDDHNIGDLPFHIGIITGFAEGGNYPPQHPELAGTRLTYPFLVDMISALLVASGASLRASLFWPNLLLAAALVVLLYHWARRLTRDRLAGAFAPLLVLFSGGLGFALLVPELAASERPWELLAHLPRDYTIAGEGGLRWGNALTTLLIPQRSLLLGVPLFLIVATWWWRAVAEAGEQGQGARLMTAAGLAAGLLPLSHAHSFALAVALGGALALLFPRRLWVRFFVPAALAALPQLWWVARGSALQTRAFLAWHLGWDRGDLHPVWFWLYNTGLFLPLLAAALIFHRRLLPAGLPRFYLPFALCFLVPNLLRLSPWIWDNVKFLFYWYLASVPLVALVLARMARGPLLARVAAPVLALALVLSGALDVGRVASGAIVNVVFDADAVAFARAVADATPPGAVIADRPDYDSPVLLTGRPGLLGYPGHIWSQGLDAGDRERDLDQFYAGLLGPDTLSSRYGVRYAIFPAGPETLSGFVPDVWPSLSVVVQRGGYALVRLGTHEEVLEPD